MRPLFFYSIAVDFYLVDFYLLASVPFEVSASPLGL